MKSDFVTRIALALAVCTITLTIGSSAARAQAGGLYTWKNLPDKYTIGGPCYAGAPAGYAMIHNPTTGYEQCAALSDMKPVGAAANPPQPAAPAAAAPAAAAVPPAQAAPPQKAPVAANPQPAAKPVSYGTNTTCAVGQKVLAEPGDHPATVLATSNMACRVHYDDGAFQDSWVETYNIKPADIYAKNAALAAAGPRIGRYNIAVGTGAYDGYLMIYSASSYELFLPSGTSAGKGTYSFNQASTSISWTSGPLTDARWDGTQKLDGNGKMLNIRIGKRSVATNTGQ